MAMMNLSPETFREMLSIIREARNDLKKWSDSASMISSALTKPEELNLKKKAENPFSLDGDDSVLLKQIPTVCEVVDGRNHQMLARNASGGREMSRNFENPLGNFVEHLVGQKQQEVSVVENPKMEWYSDGFGLQALLSISSVTSPLPKKPPDPPDMIHGKSRNKGTIFPKYSCEEMYERMEMGLCVFCEEFDTQGHYQLKHKGLQVLVMECDDEEKVEELVDSVSVVLDQQEKKATDQEYEHAKAKLEDYCSLPNEHQDDSALLIESSNDIEFSDFHTNVLSRSELALCISGNEEKHCVCLSQVRIWEPGGLPTEAAQWYWPEKCKSLRVSAATSDLRLTRQLHIQTKELLSEFQDVPRLLVSAFEFGAKIHKPPDPNEKLLDDETLGKFRRVKVLMAEVSFDLVPSKEDYIILENEIKWKLRETPEAEVNYGFHSRWGFTAVITAEWRRPRAYFHTTYEKMVCSREAMHLVDGMCIHGFEARRGMFEMLLPSQPGDEPLLHDVLVEKSEGYSGSDIRILCKEAAMQPLRRTLAVLEDTEELVPEDELPKVGAILPEDIDRALSNTRPSAHLHAHLYDKFNDDYGSHILK